MPKLEAYLAVEATVAETIAAVWAKRARKTGAEIKQAINAGDFNRAFDLAAAITLHDVAASQRENLEEFAVSALLLGASRLVPMKQTAFMTGALPLPSLLGPALDQLEKMVEAAAESVRRVAARVIEEVEEEAKQSAFAKAEIDLADKLNGLVMGTGKGLIAVGANLVTSRLVSYGFLAQAQQLELESYQMSEVLDTRICPVCEARHSRSCASTPGSSRSCSSRTRTRSRRRRPGPSRTRTRSRSCARCPRPRSRPAAGARPPITRCAVASWCRSAPSRRRCRSRS
jgi:hypothetical protein